MPYREESDSGDELLEHSWRARQEGIHTGYARGVSAPPYHAVYVSSEPRTSSTDEGLLLGVVPCVRARSLAVLLLSPTPGVPAHLVSRNRPHASSVPHSTKRNRGGLATRCTREWEHRACVQGLSAVGGSRAEGMVRF